MSSVSLSSRVARERSLILVGVLMGCAITFPMTLQWTSLRAHSVKAPNIPPYPSTARLRLTASEQQPSLWEGERGIAAGEDVASNSGVQPSNDYSPSDYIYPAASMNPLSPVNGPLAEFPAAAASVPPDSPCQDIAKIQPGGVSTGIQNRPLPDGSKCVSLAYSKAAKTGSDSLRRTWGRRYRNAKLVDCPKQDEFNSLNVTRSTESSAFDGVLCHNIWDAETVSVIASQARFPLLKITTIRDPVDQFISLYWYMLRKSKSRRCGSGRVATLKEVETFTTEIYYPRIPSFHSRDYTIEQLSSSLAWEECAAWDVIWKTDNLKDILKNDVNVHPTQDCPEKRAFKDDPAIMTYVYKVTEPARMMYQEMLKRPKVMEHVPFTWDESEDCFVIEK